MAVTTNLLRYSDREGADLVAGAAQAAKERAFA